MAHKNSSQALMRLHPTVEAVSMAGEVRVNVHAGSAGTLVEIRAWGVGAKGVWRPRSAPITLRAKDVRAIVSLMTLVDAQLNKSEEVAARGAVEEGTR